MSQKEWKLIPAYPGSVLSDRACRRAAAGVLRLFWDRRFAHYTWIGGFVTVFNILFLVVTIDWLGVPTVVASLAGAAATFILRYAMFALFKVLG